MKQQQTRYKTFAHFYKNEHGQHCRKYLDIKAAECTAPQPELIMLMLIPGNCGEEEDVALETDVEVKADPTLHRVQGFMKRHALCWVRVLNISDVREKSSAVFFQKLGHASNLPEHSIFHPSRKEDLIQHAKLETPFLLAWGTDKRKEAIASPAVMRLKEQGYPIINEQGPHLHPLSKPITGMPVWTEYADEVYQEYLKKKNLIAESDRLTKAEQAERARLILEDRIISAFKLFNQFDFGNPVITEAKAEGRWTLFARQLAESQLKPYIGTSDYDYIFIDHIADAEALFNLLQKHNGRKIIIDAAASPQILTMKGGIELLEDAMCLNPETGMKWKVGHGYSLPRKAPFTFNGKIALLLDINREEMEGDKRYECLLQEGIVI